MKRSVIRQCLGLCLLSATLACGPGGAPAPVTGDQASNGAAPDPRANSAAGTLPPEVRVSLDKALSAYEQIHVQLATDQTGGIGDSAAIIEASSIAAESAAPEALRPQLEALAKSGAEMKEASGGGDVAAARVAFADLSQSVVGLLSAEPSLTDGRFIFECPMTDHYKKWVQTAKEITNPYMGSRMLECGAPSEWKE